MKRKKALSILITIFVVVMFNSSVSFAEEDIEGKRVKCEMTIDSSKHYLGSGVEAQASGECNGLVFGQYAPEADVFYVDGNVSGEVYKNGQTFNVPSPYHDYNPILTVYIVKKNVSKPDKPKEDKPKENKPKQEDKSKDEVKTPESSKPKNDKPKTDSNNKPSNSNTNKENTENSNTSKNTTSNNTSVKNNVNDMNNEKIENDTSNDDEQAESTLDDTVEDKDEEKFVVLSKRKPDSLLAELYRDTDFISNSTNEDKQSEEVKNEATAFHTDKKIDSNDKNNLSILFFSVVGIGIISIFSFIFIRNNKGKVQ